MLTLNNLAVHDTARSQRTVHKRQLSNSTQCEVGDTAGLIVSALRERRQLLSPRLHPLQVDMRGQGEDAPLRGNMEKEEDDDEPLRNSVSTTSLILERANDNASHGFNVGENMEKHRQIEALELEDQLAWQRGNRPVDRRVKRLFWGLLVTAVVGWFVALVLFAEQTRRGLKLASSGNTSGAHEGVRQGRHGKAVELDQVLDGEWSPTRQSIRWIAGPEQEDGMLLEEGGKNGTDYLVVEDVRFQGQDFAAQKSNSRTLMKHGRFTVDGYSVQVDDAWPNADHSKVLVRSDFVSNWRYSGLGLYWIFDVASQTGQPLDAQFPRRYVQHASWSPVGNEVVFTRDNNMYIRRLTEGKVRAITTDGSKDLFYGVPDWVYEEEVFSSDSATWWSGDGRFVAFLRTNETNVPEFPVQYFFSRPSGTKPKAGEENYPEVKKIKYPKSGSPMSTVGLRFYDVENMDTFEIQVDGDFEDEERLITEVVWADDEGKVLVRSTNRESDVLKMGLLDAVERTGKVVRQRDLHKLDGGWFEISHTTKFVPADPGKQRKDSGYIDTVIHDGFDHLAYFAPLDNPIPRLLTEGQWEVVESPLAVDVRHGAVYFSATKDGSTERHIYTVQLSEGPSSIQRVAETDERGYYEATFSSAAGFMLLDYLGPAIPWQKIAATPSNLIDTHVITLEENTALAKLAAKTELPKEVHQTIVVDGYELNLVERRPPHFDESGKSKYPVLFYQYSGPGSQQVNQKFAVDFQSYVASKLGYIVVTVDGRGTGFKGRALRTVVRGNLGYWEAHDQIAAAKMWASKKYVDPEKLAIWGWSYGGFMTLKTLEMDAGQTFKYGMAVAPVTDWRFYDSIYTERYMHLPQDNKEGYDNATISGVSALGSNVKFLIMHGFSDDNVHFQNTLALLDKLDVAGVRNYDVHVFPDSDHSIYFHGANSVVYHSK